MTELKEGLTERVCASDAGDTDDEGEPAPDIELQTVGRKNLAPLRVARTWFYSITMMMVMVMVMAHDNDGGDLDGDGRIDGDDDVADGGGDRT